MLMAAKQMWASNPRCKRAVWAKARTVTHYGWLCLDSIARVLVSWQQAGWDLQRR